VPEAEDVLLEAAERASSAVRNAWERHRGAPRRGEQPTAGAAQRRLVAWQSAWLGRSWPVIASDARPLPGLLARRFRSVAPWAARDAAAPFTDGRRVWLPRGWLEESADARLHDAALLSTLSLARRLVRRTHGTPPRGSRLLRDLHWLTEGALADAAIAREWPGLVPALRALRAETLAARPARARLRPAERAVEDWLCGLLDAAPGCLPAPLAGAIGPGSEPIEVLAFAEERASLVAADPSRYRGVAPVTHWGVYHPETTERAQAGRTASSDGVRPSRGGRLRRPLQRREPDPDASERPGPFVLPFSDPHLTVDDPGDRMRPTDRGHDEDPETLAEELARLEGLAVVQDDAPVREVLEDGGAERSSRPGEAEALARPGPVWLYPEWDVARGAYRDPGCRVREVPAAVDDRGWSEATLAARRDLLTQLCRQLECLRPRRQRLRRRPDGDDLDLCGWLEDWAGHHAGRAPAGRIYTQERPLRRDVAVTLLLDASGSTESWLSGSQRIIDVVKEAALVFGEALGALGDRSSLLAFSGQGAGDVRIRALKRFGESPGPSVRRRIGALEPDAFTRLGGALRHATAVLVREPARARLLLLLSDGKPQDEDGYEGHYGIEDVRQAVAEARLQGVRVFCVTVDREGPDYLPRLFGPHAYTVIWNAETLPERLPALYRRLTRQS
jgi:nitric oxide reductase NorD protein